MKSASSGTSAFSTSGDRSSGVAEGAVSQASGRPASMRSGDRGCAKRSGEQRAKTDGVGANKRFAEMCASSRFISAASVASRAFDHLR